MSRAVWKQVPDNELVKWFTPSAYLLYKNSNPRIGIFRNQVTGHYKVALCGNLDFTLADGLTSRAEVIEFIES